MSNKENKCLNFFKGLAAIAVVYLHTCYGTKITPIMVCLARFAVPLFFMISGYFCFYEKSNSQAIIKKIKSTAKKCLVFEIIYFLFYAIVVPLGDGKNIDFLKYCNKTFTVKSFFNFVFLNQSFNSSIMWFVYALLYLYVIAFFVNKYDKYNLFFVIGIILLILHVLGRGALLHMGMVSRQGSEIWFRNVWFMGIPFFYMGAYIKQNEKKIVSLLSVKSALILMIVGFALSLIERRFTPLEIFIGTTIAVLSIFVLCLKKADKQVLKPIYSIGKSYYMELYVGQMIAYYAFMKITTWMHITWVGIYMIRPALIVIMIIACVFTTRFFRKKIIVNKA